MRPWLVRHLVCPLHERLLGRRTLRFLRELEWSQWSAPDDLRRLQAIKLAALLRHAAANTSFYRDRFRGAGVRPDDPDAPASLHRLPFLNKDDIRGSIDAMLWHGCPGGLHVSHTGGSTGEPLTFYYDRRRQGYDQAARLRSQRWFGVRLGDPQLYLWGSPIEVGAADRMKRLRDRLFNHDLLDAFDMSPARLDTYLDAWDRFRPVSLYGYPSSIAMFVQHAQWRGRRLDTSRLRAVFVTGEVCLPQDREAIGSYFRVPVADGYGSRDGGFIAHECPHGRMHLTAENVLVELIDGNGPAATGEAGEIVITHLDAYAMPLIRYRTGDVGRLVPGRCACGRGLPLMDVVQGRTTDALHLRDGTVKHGLSIIYPLRALAGVRRFCVTQFETYGVLIEVVRNQNADALTREKVLRSVRPVLGAEAAVTVRFVDDIPAAPSGKFRYVASHVRPSAKSQLGRTQLLRQSDAALSRGRGITRWEYDGALDAAEVMSKDA